MKPLEFEKISIDEARLALDGVRAKPGAHKGMDRRTRTSEEPLLNVTKAWLASLPQDVRPKELPQRSPRISNRLRHLWKQVARCEEYLHALLFDYRGTRKGFPNDIAKELETLREYYALLHPPVPSSWDNLA